MRRPLPKFLEDASKKLSGSTDVFEKLIADSTTNNSNLASHYPYSPERWRLFKGDTSSGNRLFPEYNSVSEYNHAGDVHELKPAAGETIIFESAVKYSYTVAYELAVSFAVRINQSLQSGDHVRFGYYDGTDGWFFEVNDTHGSNEADFVTLRSGSEKQRKTIKLQKQVFGESLVRFEILTAWYNISRQLLKQSYSENGYQENPVVGRASIDDGKGPEIGNLNLRYEVKAGSSTSNLVLEAGSAALITRGNEIDNTRSKSKLFQDDFAAADTWVPLRAFREEPDKDIVNSQLLSLKVLSFDSNDTIEIAALSFDETNVTFTGTDSWDTPDIWSGQNNALQTRSDVSQVADQNGTLVADALDPGGFQVGQAVLSPTDGKQFKKGVIETEVGVKRNIPDGDIIVIMAKSTGVGTVGYVANFEQDW